MKSTHHGYMPGNMTMERPRSWIVGIILDHEVAIASQHLCITSLGIFRTHNGFTVPSTVAIVKNKYVVAMEMNWLEIIYD